MNTTEYAAHRRAKGLTGCTRQAVDKAVEDGTLTPPAIDERGQIVNAEIADEQWASRRRPRAENTATIAAASDRPVGNLAERKLAAETGLRELDLLERQGKLVEIEPVTKLWARVMGNVAAALESLPTELAQPLSEESDPKRCEAILRKRLDEIRNMLPQEFEDMAVEVAKAA